MKGFKNVWLLSLIVVLLCLNFAVGTEPSRRNSQLFDYFGLPLLQPGTYNTCLPCATEKASQLGLEMAAHKYYAIKAGGPKYMQDFVRGLLQSRELQTEESIKSHVFENAAVESGIKYGSLFAGRFDSEQYLKEFADGFTIGGNSILVSSGYSGNAATTSQLTLVTGMKPLSRQETNYYKQILYQCAYPSQVYPNRWHRTKKSANRMYLKARQFTDRTFTGLMKGITEPRVAVSALHYKASNVCGHTKQVFKDFNNRYCNK